MIVEKPFDKKLLYKINLELDSYLRIKDIILIDDFSEFLTPKMSIKRRKLINWLKERYLLK